MNKSDAIYWFKRKKRDLLREIRAYDDFTAALAAVERIRSGFETHEDPLGQLSGALFMRAVVFYARQFLTSKNRYAEKETYPLKSLNEHPAFDERLHKHIVDLRTKVIAHSDSREVLPSLNILTAKLSKRGASETKEVAVGGTLISYSFSSVSGDRFLSELSAHLAACIEIVKNKMDGGIFEYTEAYQQYPEYGSLSIEEPTKKFSNRPFVLEPYKPGFDLDMDELTTELISMPTGNLHKEEYEYRVTKFTKVIQDISTEVGGEAFKLKVRPGKDLINIPEKTSRLGRWWEYSRIRTFCRSFIGWWRRSI
jgi:hypothetical protein